MSVEEERRREARGTPLDALRLWELLFDGPEGYLVTFVGRQSERPDARANELDRTQQRSWRYPQDADKAAAYLKAKSEAGCDAYFGVHLYREPIRRGVGRTKEKALDKVSALWCDGDGAQFPGGSVKPHIDITSSPGRNQFYVLLSRPVPGERAENLCKRLTYWIGGDKGKWCLTTLLRPPGTNNYKRKEPSEVTGQVLTEERWDPDELDRLLPPLKEGKPNPVAGKAEPTTRTNGPGPPVRLKGKALHIYEGRSPIMADSGVDRSATLMQIGSVLYNAGLGRPGLVPALEERDRTLGFDKYLSRPEEYDRIVEKLEATGRRDTPHSATGPGSSRAPSSPATPTPGVPNSTDYANAERQRKVDAVDADSRGLRELPGALPFPVDAMPGPCKFLIKEAAAAIGCPPEFVGVPMLVVLGSAIGNSRVIKLKEGWEESATIYAATIAEPGEKKSPAAKVAVAPAIKKQAELRSYYKQRQKEYEQELRDYETDKKDAAKFGHNAPPEPEPPKMDRTLVEDTTIEALIRVLGGAPRGVAAVRDELTGWLRSLDQYKQGGKGADRQFWLSGWTNSLVVVDRKGEEEPTMLGRPFSGLFGSIQPGVLPELGQGRDDGLFDRFLVAYPTPTPSRWTDDEITEGARNAYRKLYDKLRDLHMPVDEYGDPDPTRVHFSPDAKAVLIDAINDHREEMEQPGFPSRLKGPWAKMEAYIARLCLILAMSRAVGEGVAERVEAKDVLSATVLIDYYKNHARRAYVGLYGENPDDRLAEDVAEFLKARGGHFKDEPTVLYEQLESDHKGTRSDELSKRIRAIAKRSPAVLAVNTKNIKKDGQSRRALEITLVNGVNGVNRGEGKGKVTA